MPEVFISYSKSDRTHALDLAGELRTHGFSVWIDQGSIGGAKNWATEIVEAIDACPTFLCLLSPHSLASRNVAKELHLASEKQKHILPVLIERVTLPSNFEYSLAGLQRVYYHDRPAIFQALESFHHGIVATEQFPLAAPAPEDDSIRIAVLPFDDLSPDHDNQWFADGMMDELISTLGSLDRVKVPSRSDVLHYRDHRKKSREVANEMGVRYLIEGGVRKSKEKIRINATLTDTLRGEQLWTNKFDGTFEDVFAFQELVSKDIAAALKLKLTPEEEQKVDARGTQNAEAYELYLKGRHEQYYVTKESYLRALDFYEQAAKLDPKFARAYINTALTACAYFREYSKNPKWLSRAEDNLAKAFEITGETSRTLMIAGMIEWLRGNMDSAVETLSRSVALDPKNYNGFNLLGSIYMSQRNYPAAAEAFQRVVALVENTMAYSNLLGALGAGGDQARLSKSAESALPVFDRYLMREPNDHSAAASRALVLLWAGRKQEAEDAANRVLGFGDLSGNVLFDLGCLFNYLGDRKKFLTLMRNSIGAGFREIDTMRNLVDDVTEPDCLKELKIIIDELANVVERERAE